MSTLNIPLFYRRMKDIHIYSYLSPNLALLLTLSGLNYLHLEQISMVPKMFKPLRFDYICTSFFTSLKVVELSNFNSCQQTSKWSKIHFSNQDLLALRLTFILFLKGNICSGYSLELP